MSAATDLDAEYALSAARDLAFVRPDLGAVVERLVERTHKAEAALSLSQATGLAALQRSWRLELLRASQARELRALRADLDWWLGATAIPPADLHAMHREIDKAVA